jgi:hypothetical protein
MGTMKHTTLLLMLLVSTPVFAGPNCKTMADDVAYQDQLLKKESQEFTDRYGEANDPGTGETGLSGASQRPDQFITSRHWRIALAH